MVTSSTSTVPHSILSTRPTPSFQPDIVPCRSLDDRGRSPPGPSSTTVAATIPVRASIELADFHPPPQESARTRPAGRAARPFEPAASSLSLARLGSGLDTEWEKSGSSPDQLRRQGSRFTRLWFWAEALRRRARNPIVEQEPTAEMKFSHSIQFNAVPDWSSNYIAYSNLKKL
ncbi:hypothetical protein N7510_010798 [Penicillium lagena]|uniref:uncharacterized protein n=1 Tax=Penicillium lagena TaxID=94218 RepID=UPI00253F6649|nr:uncharacterized protein N7510_010798 [Penicillium lagena]KAJ5601264.1 hypothetical protein N7510_010798 [Penicillium lagena]